jgi:Gluconate 2-dehydrogenase subunit 3
VSRDGPDGGAARGLTPAQLAHLAAIQDRLIPPEGALPGAGASGAAHRVDRLLAERPEWRADLLAALQAIGAGFLDLDEDEQEAALRAVERAHPGPFRRLLRLTYTAYYTDPAVLRAHGYREEPPLPRGHPLTPFDESRLDPVRRRGQLWRDA